MASPTQIRQEITGKIVAALEAGTVVPFWRRPWSVSKNSGRPANVVNRRCYSGINVLLCEIHRLRYGLSCRWFGTMDQINALGGKVKKRPADVAPGEWACRVVFFRQIEKTVTDKTTGEQKIEHVPLLRTYTLFNIDQCEGEALDRFRVDADMPDVTDACPNFEPVERLIEASGADIRHGGDQAYYIQPIPLGSWPDHTDGDRIHVPERRRFLSLGRYYETLLHELAHHSEVRLGYDRQALGYAFLELVAELSASYISTELGVPDGEDQSNHVAYLKSWLDGMRGDSSFIFRAASMASRTTDHLLAKVQRTGEVSDETVSATADVSA